MSWDLGKAVCHDPNTAVYYLMVVPLRETFLREEIKRDILTA